MKDFTLPIDYRQIKNPVFFINAPCLFEIRRCHLLSLNYNTKKGYDLMKYSKEYKDECFSQFLEGTIVALEVLLKLKKINNERIISMRDELIQMLKNNEIDTDEKMESINNALNTVLTENGHDKIF